MGVEQYYISGFEAGRRNITLATLWKAALSLGVEPGALLAKGPHRPELPKRRKMAKR